MSDLKKIGDLNKEIARSLHEILGRFAKDSGFEIEHFDYDPLEFRMDTVGNCILDFKIQVMLEQSDADEK